jgi:hypothetical protein
LPNNFFLILTVCEILTVCDVKESIHIQVFTLVCV